MPKVTNDFFLRAESFYDFATHIDGIGAFAAYGGRSLHHQSHGESFISLFLNRFSAVSWYIHTGLNLHIKGLVYEGLSIR